MTTVISRLYADAETANGVAEELQKAGFPADTIDVIEHDPKNKSMPSLPERLKATRIDKNAVEPYASRVRKGKVLLVVRAPFTPFGAARTAMEVVDRVESADVGIDNQNHYVQEQPKRFLNITVMTDHPKFLTNDVGPDANRRRGTISETFGIRLLSPYKTKRSAMSGGGFMSTKFLPFQLLWDKKERKNSAIAGGGTPFSKMISMPLLSKRS